MGINAWAQFLQTSSYDNVAALPCSISSQPNGNGRNEETKSLNEHSSAMMFMMTFQYQPGLVFTSSSLPLSKKFLQSWIQNTYLNL